MDWCNWLLCWHSSVQRYPLFYQLKDNANYFEKKKCNLCWVGNSGGCLRHSLFMCNERDCYKIFSEHNRTSSRLKKHGVHGQKRFTRWKPWISFIWIMMPMMVSHPISLRLFKTLVIRFMMNFSVWLKARSWILRLLLRSRRVYGIDYSGVHLIKPRHLSVLILNWLTETNFCFGKAILGKSRYIGMGFWIHVERSYYIPYSDQGVSLCSFSSTLLHCWEWIWPISQSGIMFWVLSWELWFSF